MEKYQIKLIKTHPFYHEVDSCFEKIFKDYGQNRELTATVTKVANGARVVEIDNAIQQSMGASAESDEFLIENALKITLRVVAGDNSPFLFLRMQPTMQDCKPLLTIVPCCP